MAFGMHSSQLRRDADYDEQVSCNSLERERGQQQEAMLIELGLRGQACG